MSALGICMYVLIGVSFIAHAVTKWFWTACSIIGIFVIGLILFIAAINGPIGESLLPAVCFGTAAFIVAMIVGFCAVALRINLYDDT